MAKKSKSKQKETLFNEKFVPAKPGSHELFDVSYGDDSTPVECLGMTFDNDESRRKYFLEKLREKLQDPEFRKIEGFPIGEDEDILALSDPPYYTACPNPFIGSFVSTYGEPFDEANDTYHQEPFAADVSEGKNDPIYRAHSYHTKVPHKAIMRYILHYTQPGDIVFDGFCGTGMTGLAAQLCGHSDSVQSLEYSVTPNGEIHDEQGNHVSSLGTRAPILCDLSPAATFISRTNNVAVNYQELEAEIETTLAALRKDVGWVYEVPRESNTASLIYAIWSEVVICPECSHEFPYWEAAMAADDGTIKGIVLCPECRATLSKRDLVRKTDQVYDPVLREVCPRVTHALVKQCVEIDRKREVVDATNAANKLLEDIADALLQETPPTTKMLFREGKWGDQWRKGYHVGVTHSHHFLLSRSLLVYSRFYALALKSKHSLSLLWLLTATLEGSSKLNRERPSGLPSKLPGTLYIGSSIREINVMRFLERKAAKFPRLNIRDTCVAISTQSSTRTTIPSDCVDYIFIDPPFGDNLAYSELNFPWESWLRVFTSQEDEAIVSRFQGKTLTEYMDLMLKCFVECHRILKPGRWMTVEFHNSKNAVWNAIQEALTKAGFMVADVRTIDKQQGSFNQVVAASAVKQDLVISAYKPTISLEREFALGQGTLEGAWTFINKHLDQLPLLVSTEDRVEVVAERQDYLLFDRMVAFHVQRGVTVPLSAAECYAGLRERFPERDGMFFLPGQVVEYDNRRQNVSAVEQLELFVSDESSAIKWLKRQLGKKPQTFSELQPQLMREIAGWEKHEMPLELSELLEQSFLCYYGKGEVPSQIHSYLSSNFHDMRNLDNNDPKLIAKAKNRWYVPDPRKEADLEKIRHRALMKEFNEYLEGGKKLKVVRTEAMRAGFKECWQNGDYRIIVDMVKRVKDSIIQEDPALLMYYDNALMRTGD